MALNLSKLMKQKGAPPVGAPPPADMAGLMGAPQGAPPPPQGMDALMAGGGIGAAPTAPAKRRTKRGGKKSY